MCIYTLNTYILCVYYHLISVPGPACACTRIHREGCSRRPKAPAGPMHHRQVTSKKKKKVTLVGVRETPCCSNLEKQLPLKVIFFRVFFCLCWCEKKSPKKNLPW